MKVAIQGIKGSYHHQVAQSLYGSVSLLECYSFDKLVIAVDTGEVDKGIMAIGNSIAGTLLPNYSLLQQHKLYITREVYLNIEHQLMALPGQCIEELKEVHSHPMALRQCQTFFTKYPRIKLVETDDTAAAAQRIFNSSSQQIGAIASREAAHLYGLELLATGIQQTVNNTTRFVVIEKKPIVGVEVNKATINFISKHEKGSLAAILTMLASHNINLSKIQSIPIVEKPFLFSFVVDLEFENLKFFLAAKEKLRPLVNQLEVMGVYKKATL